MKVETVLETARAQIGYREGANNNNIYGREYGLNFQPWCVIFLWWCFKHSLDASWEKLSDFFPNSAHCDGVRSFAKSIGCWVTSDYQVGDLIIFDYDGNGSGDHIAIIEAVNADGSFTTIEGNHNDAVARVRRTKSGISGAYRPEYEWGDYVAVDNNIIAEPNEQVKPKDEPIETVPEDPNAILKIGAIGKGVSIIQYALYIRGYAPSGSRKKSGDWDGEYGEGTKRAVQLFQLDHSIPASGCINEETLKALWKGGE